jgi:GNAT superfamily N-acetyltransferase
MSVFFAKTDAEIRDCWPVMFQLRPNLEEKDFVATIRKQFEEGYRLAFIRRKRKVVAAAGFRVMSSLFWGRFCYVDDLVTDERARSQGLGKEMLDWVGEFARAQGCQRLELDSGVQRFAAHRFYLRQRMWISCHHFSLDLKDRNDTGKAGVKRHGDTV